MIYKKIIYNINKILYSILIVNLEKITYFIVKWLNNYLLRYDLEGYVVGLSGGIDSALVSYLTALTGKPVLIMELLIYSHKKEINRRKEFINFLKKKFLNIQFISLNLYNNFISLYNNIKNNNSNIEITKKNILLANLQSRLRMMILYYYAGLNNYIVTGTGNKIEDFSIGFFTKYGDGGVDISPIADLNKTQIFSLSKYFNFPESILKAVPSDGLWLDNRSDEDQIGLSYKNLEWAMEFIENKNLTKSNYKNLSINKINILNKYYKLHYSAKHKINSIPVCKIPYCFKNNSK